MSGPAWRPAGTLIPPRHLPTLGEKVVQAVVLLGALAVVLALGWVLRFLVLPVVLGLLLVYIISPLADRLEDRGLSRRAAVSICMGVLLGGLAVVALGTWPSLESWLREAPQAGQQSVFEVQLEKRLSEWQTALSARYLRVDWPAVFEKVRHVMQAQQHALVEELPAMALGILSHAGAVALALVITVFVLLDGAEMKKAIVARVPNRHFENALVMLARVDRQIASYLIGTAAESALVTVLLAIPLFLLGMPNAFLFAVLFGVANVIPFAGPFIGASAGLFFCMLDPHGAVDGRAGGGVRGGAPDRRVVHQPVGDGQEPRHAPADGHRGHLGGRYAGGRGGHAGHHPDDRGDQGHRQHHCRRRAQRGDGLKRKGLR